MEKLANFINGELLPPASGRYLEVFEPATGDVYAQAPDSDSRDVDAAVAAAEKAFPRWSTTSLEERSRLLLELARLIDQNLESFAMAESIDNGKPVTLARTVDIPRASSNFRFFATALLHFASESHFQENLALNYTLRQPLGVVGCISPWNLPLYLFTWKIAPALAAGNCVIGKPSEVTPMTAYLLSKLCKEAGLPPGVLNILHGTGINVGACLSKHPKIPALSFTGGTKTGAEIARTAAPLFKKLSLELGGKNPTILFADCSYEEALQTTLRSAFSNQGEICLCGSRLLIERPLYERFKKDFVQQASQLVVGDPKLPQSQQGAIVSKEHFHKILSYIDLARKEGGTVLCGGSPVSVPGRCAKGWFLAPTIIEGLGPYCRTNQEEIFGPVVTLIPFDTEEEALEYANGTPYGLAANLWTQNLSRAHSLASRLKFGIVWINCWMLRDLRTPFGGTKESGVGREGGFEAMRFFTEPKNVCVKF